MGTAGSRERARAGPSRDPRTIRRTDGWTDGRTERYGGKIRSGTVGGPSRDSPASTLLRTVSIWPSLPAPALSLSVSVSSLFVLVLVPALFRRSFPSVSRFQHPLVSLCRTSLSSTFRLALFLLSILHLVSSRLFSSSPFHLVILSIFCLLSIPLYPPCISIPNGYTELRRRCQHAIRLLSTISRQPIYPENVRTRQHGLSPR